MKARLFNRGFTLIEILVVLAIIGILSAVLYANFSDARQSSKNQAFRSELKEVQLGLELYKAQFGRYPDAQDISVSGCSDNAGNIDSASSIDCNIAFNPYIVGLTPDYIAELPSHLDSGNGACELIYQVDDSVGDRYKLTATNCYAGASGPGEGIQLDDEFARCPNVCTATVGSCSGDTMNAAYLASAPFYESLAIYSTGAECW